ncbi:MAG: Rrf2 family transcriptional regulator [Proteobacteria bacterium]|nr:MAG: Rrf2 family transcriptional regulator [Pseudomonadota bacterium]
MNKINRKVEYALISLKHMRAKTPGELTTAKEIATLYGCPFDVISRVLQTLGKKGIVRSEQGAYGGYQINKDLARVSFFELNEVILGRVAVAKCIHTEAGETPCEMRGTCNIVSPVNTLNKKLLEFYRGLSVAELLESKPTRGQQTAQEVRTSP